MDLNKKKQNKNWNYECQTCAQKIARSKKDIKEKNLEAKFGNLEMEEKENTENIHVSSNRKYHLNNNKTKRQNFIENKIKNGQAKT